MGPLTVSYDAIQYLDPGADVETESYRKGVMKYEANNIWVWAPFSSSVTSSKLFNLVVPQLWCLKRKALCTQRLLSYLFYLWASIVAHMLKNLPAVHETLVPSLHWEDLLEEKMAIHSSILTWRIPWTRSLVGYSPWGSKELLTTEATWHGMASIYLSICLSIFIYLLSLSSSPTLTSLVFSSDRFFFNYSKNHVSKNLLGKQTSPNTT